MDVSEATNLRKQRPPLPARSIAFVLDRDGNICDFDPAAEELLKYRRKELLGKHISVVLPQLQQPQLMHDGAPTPRLRFLSHIGRRFDMVTGDGQKRLTDLFLPQAAGPEPAEMRVMIRPD